MELAGIDYTNIGGKDYSEVLSTWKFRVAFDQERYEKRCFEEKQSKTWPYGQKKRYESRVLAKASVFSAKFFLGLLKETLKQSDYVPPHKMFDVLLESKKGDLEFLMDDFMPANSQGKPSKFNPYMYQALMQSKVLQTHLKNIYNDQSLWAT